MVVVLPPRLDDGAGLGAAAKPLQVEALIAKFAVETLVEAILPGLARIDKRCLNAFAHQPLQDRTADELRPVVRAQVTRGAVQAHQPRQHINHPLRSDAARDIDSEAFARPFVDDREALELPPVGTRVEDEIDRPHVVASSGCLRSRAPRGDAASRAFARYLQPGQFPKSMHAVAAHGEAFGFEEDADTPVAIAWVLPRELAHAVDDGRVGHRSLGCEVKS